MYRKGNRKSQGLSVDRVHPFALKGKATLVKNVSEMKDLY